MMEAMGDYYGMHLDETVELYLALCCIWHCAVLYDIWGCIWDCQRHDEASDPCEAATWQAGKQAGRQTDRQTGFWIVRTV